MNDSPGWESRLGVMRAFEERTPAESAFSGCEGRVAHGVIESPG